MKFKRDILIITLIIAIIFTISSVCAADSGIQAMEAHNSTDTVSTLNDDNLKMNDANEILAGTEDFTALNETINGNSPDTYIELERDYRGSSFNGGNGIEIGKNNVVIDGKGHTINCTGENSRMFNVMADGITLKNIIFAGGSSDCGGAIYTNKELTIINCTFIDNQATSGADNLGGGAIYGNDVKMSIYDCTFIDNYAHSKGGAICAAGDNSENLEIFNCTFIDNVANTFGGAFYSGGYYQMGNIINSTFIGNRADSGGAIYNYAEDGTVGGCIFINNTGGNSIIHIYSALTVTNSILVNNMATDIIGVIQTPNIVVDNNWWGTTADDVQGPVVAGETLENYYILDMTADDDSIDITLNNLYDNGAITTSYTNYALPSIIFNVKATNIEVNDNVVLGNSGVATIEHAPAAVYVITIEYNGVKLTRDVKPSFKWLSSTINSDGSEISLEQDCIYDSTKDYVLTNGIEFAKDMAIDGQGHVIDALGLSNIIYFDDDANSYSLTLKNIIFANATSVEGAAVYFKGNKLEIINCTFINNRADSQGDAIYVANAVSNANMITESLFTENTGNNSIICINLDSNANLKMDNSIFMKNSAANNIKGTDNVIVEYNWMGNTFENKEDAPETEGVNVTNWLFLKIDAVAAMNGYATVSLNNVYDHGEISKYGEYALQPITLTLGGLNAVPSVPTITLGDDGQASYQFRMDRAVATLTASNVNVTTSTQLEYTVVDDGSFRALNEIIFFSEDGDVIELTHDYVYSDSDTITEGIVIPRKITINGNGHTIDAKAKTRIFWIPEGVCDITINNISFTNAKASYGAVLVINQHSNNFNFSNCNFTDNAATDYGGVIDCVGDYCTIENCNFINNRAVSKAGVIRYYHNTQAYIKNSNFINNRVADGSNGGGVIYVDDGAVDIDKSVFIGNIANDRLGSVIYTLKSATITNSIFFNNPGTYSIYGGSGVTLTNNWFGNTSSDYNSFGDAYQTASGVYHETSLNNWLYLDINFFDDYAVISLNNEYVKSSNSTGVISNYNLLDITLNITSNNLNLSTNKVTLGGNGKARVYYGEISDNATLTANNAYVSLTKDIVVRDFYVLQELINENDCLELGRDYEYNSEDSITEGISINRNITIDGKGHTIDAKAMTRIFNVHAANVTLKNIIFANGKSSSGDGGAICFKSDGGNYNIENCTFSNNTAEGKGAAIYINTRSAEFNLYDSIFTQNRAENDGALYIETNNTEITIDKCLFRKNEPAGDSNQSRGSAIIWNSTNDAQRGVVKNSVFLDNGHQNDNGMYVFLLVSGNVTIDDNWWGTTAQDHPETFNSSFVGGGLTPNTWLFINSDVSSNRLLYNETAKIKYCLQLHDGTDTTDFDNTKLPYVDFDVSCDMGELDKDKVSLNEEFAFRVNDIGNTNVNIYCNGIVYQTLFYGPYMIFESDVPLTIYSNQSWSKDKFIRTADGNYDNVIISCNDSSIISVGVDGICAKATEGTAKLTFYYDGSDSTYPFNETLDLTVRVVKVPLNITVTNLESKEITLNVTDTLDLDISFEIDEIHKGYALAWDTLGVDYDSSIIAFSYDNTVRSENGSYYRTGHITAKAGGSTDLTIYSTSDIFKAENYTIKITVKKIPTDITLVGGNSFKVDDVSNVNANFYINGTLDAQTQLVYESNNVNVVDFISNTGDFNATGNGTAVLTVRFEGNSTHEGSSKTINVTVTKYETTTSVTDNEISLRIDEKSQIAATVTSQDSSFAGIPTYASGNESVATVDANGIITAIGNGTVTITVRYAGDRKHEGSQDTLTVHVFKIPTQITAENMVLNCSDENVEIGACVNVTGESPLYYSSSNESVVTVSADGKLTALCGGRAQITIICAESEKYLSSAKTITVTVKKLETKIVVGNRISTRYNETIEITPTVVNVNGTRIDEGNLSFFIGNEQISNLFTVDRVGEFNITVKYAENPRYLSSEFNIAVISEKAKNIITVSVDDATYHNNVTVKVTADQDGNYTVDINGTIVKVEVLNGNGQSRIALPAGSYYANITGYSNPLFCGVASNDTFTIAKIDSSVSIVVLNDVIHVGEAIRLKAVVPSDATGNVTFSLSGDVTVGVGENATLGGLSAGNHTIYAVYNGDTNYRASKKVNVTINVVKYDLNLSVAADDIAYGEKLVVNVDSDANFTGDVLVKVGKLSQTVQVTGGVGNVTFANLTAGEYSVTAIFTENSNFYGVTANGAVTVNKADSSVGIVVLNDVIYVGEAIRVRAVVPSDATGNVTFSLSGDVTVGVGENATLGGLSAGTHIIYAVYNGDNNYNPSNKANTTITVVKYETEIIVGSLISTKYNETVVISPTVANVNGSRIDDGNLSFFIGNEQISNPFTVDRVGEFNITVKYAESPKYLPSEANIRVVSDKANNNIIVSVDDATYPNNVTVVVTAGQDGNYTVDINGTIVEVEVVDGKGQNNIALSAGSYYANVTGYSSPLFHGITSNDTFTVVKADSSVGIVVLNDVIYVGEAIKVRAIVPSDAVGNVTFSLSGDVTVNVGEIATLKGLSAGTYTIHAVYKGDNNYKPSNEVNATINVVKYETEIVVGSLISTKYNETIVISPTVVNVNGSRIDDGNLSFFIDDEQIANPFTVDRVGEFNITVKYSGTSTYLESDANIRVVSDKANNNISVSVDDVVYPNEVTVEVTAGQDGNYTVDINGTIVEVEVVDGKGQNNIALSAGSYYANVTGYSSPLFYGIASNDTFTVNKADSSIGIIVLNEIIYVGEDITVKAIVPAGATGNVTFRFNDEKTVDVGDVATFEGLSAGTYTIYAIYNGDGNYRASKEANATIKVVKYDLNLTVAADDITYGENLVVEIKTDSNFTGEILVKIGELYQTAYITNGVGNVTFVNLTPCDYFITVSSAEDDTFYGAASNGTVTVNKAESYVEIIVLNDVIHVGEAIKVRAVVPSDATGNVTFILAGDVTVGVGEIATLEGLSAGTYTIHAVYNGDNNYKPSNEANATINVVKYQTGIVVGSLISTNYNETIVISPTVVNVNGTRIDEGNLSFFIDNEQIANPFTVDRVGEFNITVKYSGTSTYRESDANIRVVSDKANNNISVSVDDVVYPNEVTVGVTAGQDGNYTVDINGTIVKVEVINGKGQNAIVLPAGSYYANITGYSNPLFYGITSNDTFTVTKADSTIEIVVLNDVIPVGEAINVKAIVPAGATGNVTFRFTDEKTVDVGKIATFEGLSAGTYTIYAIYNGDNNYKSSKEANTTIRVVKYDVNLNVSVNVPSDIKVGDNVTVEVIIPNATGNVSVIVDGNETVVPLVNGSASVPIENVSEGSHSVVVIYVGDKTHNPANSVSNFTVPVTPVPVKSDVYFELERQVVESYSIDKYAGERGKEWIVATLKDANGQAVSNVTVQFTFDGVVYNLTTDEKGTVRFQEEKRIAKKYTGKFVFLGDETHNTNVSKVTVVVKQKMITINAPKKTYKLKAKTKKYTITLKTKAYSSANGKAYLRGGLTVKFTINGKTYKGTTNSKGQVTFKLKLNKKAKFKGTVRVDSNKGYKGGKKSVTITVK